jgi:hypothetical protein
LEKGKKHLQRGAAAGPASESAARESNARVERERRDRRDREIIDRNAARLNREARDTLEYQPLP